MKSTTVLHLPPVAGIVTDISPPPSGSSVLSWAPPDPPNGNILHYNIRVTDKDNGTIVVLIIDLSATTVDLKEYINSNGEFYVQV